MNIRFQSEPSDSTGSSEPQIGNDGDGDGIIDGSNNGSNDPSDRD